MYKGGEGRIPPNWTSCVRRCGFVYRLKQNCMQSWQHGRVGLFKANVSVNNWKLTFLRGRATLSKANFVNRNAVSWPRITQPVSVFSALHSSLFGISISTFRDPAGKNQSVLFSFIYALPEWTSVFRGQKGEVALIFNVRHNSSSSRKKKNPFGSIINPLFTRFVRQRWLEISFIHQIGNYYCYMYCKTIKKNRMKEIQTYIRVCNVEFTKGLSYYRIWQGRFHLQCVSVKSVRIVQQLNQ